MTHSSKDWQSNSAVVVQLKGEDWVVEQSKVIHLPALPFLTDLHFRRAQDNNMYIIVTKQFSGKWIRVVVEGYN